MVEVSIFRLVPEPTFNNLMAEVELRVTGLTRTDLRYRDLSELARIHQELGNALSGLVYATASDEDGSKLACKNGCSTCCFIPSNARGIGGTNFTMSILDVMTLVENYAKSKGADAALADKAIASVQQARRTKQLVPCPNLTVAGAAAYTRIAP